MNIIQRFFYEIKEKLILNKYPDWIPFDYPFPRTSHGYLYTVYHNPKFGKGSWDLNSIKELETRKN